MARYELNERDGYSRRTVITADTLDELAEKVAAKAGREVGDG